jgi:hypothetical protein
MLFGTINYGLRWSATLKLCDESFIGHVGSLHIRGHIRYKCACRRQ